MREQVRYRVLVRERLRCVPFVLLVVLVLAGCASSALGPRSTRSPGPETLTAGPNMVTAVETVDATRIRVTAQVSAPKASCAKNLSGRVTASESRNVYVQLTYLTPAANDRCTGVATASTVVNIPPLRGRELVIDDKPWVPTPGATRYRQCTGPFGCDAPPTNHCDPKWLDLAGHSGELQPERYYTSRGCTQRWLVMDVSATVTGCQLDGGTRPAGCRSTEVRWFLEFRRPTGWVVVASGREAGCASVHRIVPAFPDALCERLPAR